MKKKKRSNKKKKHQNDMEEFLPDSDEIFAFIAGYTSGGAAFGITWEELGLRPFASPEEIDKAYERYDNGELNEGYSLLEEDVLDDIEDLPFS